MTLHSWPTQATNISQGMLQPASSLEHQEDIEDPDESQGEDDVDEDLQTDPPAQQKRKGGRKPIYTTPEERKQRNRQAQAAFRERRTEYIRQLEVALKQHEDEISTLRETHRIATNECLRLRYRNSLLENILLEHGIDLQRELQMRTSSPPIRLPPRSPNTAYPPTAQRAMMNRHQQARRRISSETSFRPSAKRDNPVEHANQTSSDALLLSPLQDSFSFANLDLSLNPTQQQGDQYPFDFAMYPAHSSQSIGQVMQQAFPAAQLPYSPAATTSDRSESLDVPKNRSTREPISSDLQSHELTSPIDMRNHLGLDFEPAKRADVIASLSEAEPFDHNMGTYMMNQIRQRQASISRPAIAPSSAPSSNRQRNSNAQRLSISASGIDDNSPIHDPMTSMFPKSAKFYRDHSFDNQPLQ